MVRKVTIRKQSPKKLAITKDFYEKQAWANNDLVCGLDEVGRGCLAGPLVVSAVIFHPNKRLQMMKDSKIMTKLQLEKAYGRIIQNSWYSFGIVNSHDIDRYNIWQATLIAMRQAILNLFSICPKLPSIIVVDALPLSLNDTIYKDIEVYHFPKGENYSRSIAAASILAKVKRDSLMKSYDSIIPGYAFDKHKGYGTKIHKEALKQNGQSILHRNTFLNNFCIGESEVEEDQQQSIFF